MTFVRLHPPKNEEIALSSATNRRYALKCVSQKRNWSNNKDQWYNILVTHSQTAHPDVISSFGCHCFVHTYHCFIYTYLIVSYIHISLFHIYISLFRTYISLFRTYISTIHIIVPYIHIYDRYLSEIGCDAIPFRV